MKEANRKNVLKDVEASLLAQEAVERERVTQRFVSEDWDGAGEFLDDMTDKQWVLGYDKGFQDGYQVGAEDGFALGYDAATREVLAR